MKLCLLLRALVLALPLVNATATTAVAQDPVQSARPVSVTRLPAAEERQKFSEALYAHAARAFGPGTPEYYAVVRRGLDRFDALAAANEKAPPDWRGIDLTQLSSAPEAADRDPDSQYLTRVRLNVSEDFGARMVGSRPVPEGRFQEVVALTGAGSICTGVALNATTVLTAAHCACDLRLNREGDLLDDAKKVYVGTAIQNSATKSYPVDLRRTVFFDSTAPCGREFEPSLRRGKTDLAIVRLANGHSMNVAGAALGAPQLLSQAIGPQPQPFLVMGFGCSQPIQQGGHLYGCKQEKAGVKLQGGIVDSFHCVPGLSERLGLPPSLCVPGQRELVLADLRSRTPVDSCGGDSGGPVFLIKDLKAHLVAITSRSIDPRGSCGSGGIYGKVATAEVTTWLAGFLNAP